MNQVRMQGCRAYGRLLFAVLFLTGFSWSGLQAQTLRFSNHREVAVPEYALLRIGPFYSGVTFSQSAGYRYTRGEGNGVDFLFASERGEIKKDGSDFPLVSTLELRNYLLISRNTDLDISLRASYAHYPMETQEDEFIFDLAQEGIMGNLSLEFALTPYIKGTVFNNANYRTDYVDTRGLSDRYGGEEYAHLQNTAGLNLDWLMAKDSNMGLSLSRSDLLPRDDKFKDQESVSYAESLMYQQMINPLVMAGASVVFSQISYTAATNRPDTSFQTYSIFTTTRLTERTECSVSIGYSKAAYPPAGSGDSEADNGGMVGSLSVKTELDRGLSHTIACSRSQTTDFNAPFRIYDNYSYNLKWEGRNKVTADLRTQYMVSRPSEEWMGEYSDWMTGVDLSVPLASFMALIFNTAYSLRDNKGVSSDRAADIEWTSNYTTWASRAGLSFAVMKDVDFLTYVQHVERSSDSDTLAYKRDTFAATFTYTHQF